MDIIANSREYVPFGELKKGDIFVLFAEGEWYIKHRDDSAVKLTDGGTVRLKTTALCECKDCVLVGREIYTTLTDKEHYDYGI